MQVPVERINEDGSRETDDVSKWDLVAHSVKTVARVLRPDDEFSLVTFANDAECVIPLEKLSTLRARAGLSAIDRVELGGQTNLWAGLRRGYLELERGKDPRSCVLVVLTDGEPNIRPPCGEVVTFGHLLTRNPEMLLTTCMFGYGYGNSVDSNLLRDLARVGDGWFSYIPDAQMVGTVFINAIANIFCQFTRPTVLEYAGKRMSIQPLRYGQSVDFVLAWKLDKADLAFTAYDGTIVPVKHVTLNDPVTFDYQVFKMNVVRLLTVVPSAHNPVILKALQSLEEKFKASPAASLPIAVALLKDIDDQVALALSSAAHYARWGQHYLRMWGSAHRRQRSTNFKDAGTMCYGGAMFRKIRDTCNALFAGLPPPLPHAQPAPASPSAPSSSTTTPVATHYNHMDEYSSGDATTPATPATSTPSTHHTSMGHYIAQSNPCISGSSLALLADGTTKRVEDLSKGDAVKTMHGVGKILCVLKAIFSNGECMLVRVNQELSLTAWHPIYVGGEWRFPSSLGKEVMTDCKAVYSFLLDSEHTMVVGGIPTICLGHGFSSPSHPFYGTSKVVEAMKRLPGFEEGLITLLDGAVVRDANGVPCGFSV